MISSLQKKTSGIIKKLLSQPIWMYSLLFVIIFCFSFSSFLNAGKSFIWKQDGLSEHLPKVWYLTGHLRSIIKSFIYGTEFPSSYDFSLGLGANVLTYNGVWFLEPFDLLLTFVPRQYFENIYCLLIILRYYLVGISFLFFCHYKKISSSSSICGSLIYTFSGFALEAGIRHPTFLMPMILLPLLLLNLERIIKEDKGLCFSLLIAVSGISSLYFLYMNTIIGVIYFVLIIADTKDFRLLKKIYLIAFYYILGIMLAAVTIVPIAVAIFSSSRGETVTIATPSLWSYGKNKIKELLLYLVTPNKGNGFWTYENFCPFALFAIGHLLFHSKKNLLWKGMYIILFLFTCIPAAGFIFSGFSTISNRWCYSYAFVVAFICSLFFEETNLLNKKELCSFGIITVLFLLLAASNKKYINIYVLTGCIFVILTYTFIIYSCYEDILKGTLISRLCVLILVTLSLSVYGGLKNSPEYSDRYNQFADKGTAINSIISSPVASEYKQIAEGGFYRIDDIRKKRNNISSALILGYYGASSYNNITPSDQIAFLKALGIANTLTTSVITADFGNSTILNALLNMEYLTGTVGDEKFLPYSYIENISISKNGTFIAENKLNLPFGYTYSAILSEEDFLSLPIEKRQEALLQAVVLNEEISIKAQPKLSFDVKKADITDYSYKNATYEEKVLNVKKNNAQISLYFDPPENCELYLKMTGVKDTNEKSTQNTKVTVSEYDKSFYIRGDAYTYKLNQCDYLINLGYVDKPTDQITLIFDKTGSFIVEEIELIYLPVEPLINKIQALSMNHLENVHFSRNTLTGTLSTKEPEILCLSIPYDKGWKAYIDSQEAAVLKANLMFTALEIPAGDHEILLTYEIPGFKLGLYISITAVLFTISLLLKAVFSRHGSRLSK